MEDIKTIVEKLNEDEIKAIKDAHNYTWSQTGILCLLMGYISDIRHDRINLLNMECRDISLEGFYVHGENVLQFIKEIRFSRELSGTYLLAIAKNFFRGTAHPIYEISKNSKVKNLIAKICFEDQNQFQNFIDTLSVVRHFLSHNYTEKVKLKRWDMQDDSTITELKRRHNDGTIFFKYDGTKYFPELYNKDKKFEINISFDLSKVSIDASLFEAISIKELFFLGELCNNSLRKLIGIINSQGMASRSI